MPKQPNKLAAQILEGRLDAALSQQELAKRLNVSQGTVSNWELGKTTPEEEQIEKLGKILNLADRFSSEISAFGQWLSRARQAKAMTVAELAESARVSVPTIYNIESGRTRNPQEQVGKRLAEALKTDVPKDVITQTKTEATIKGFGEFTDFDPYDDVQLPTTSGIYVFYDISDRPVYVGEGQQIRTRVRNHADKFWFKQPIVVAAAFIEIKDDKLRKQVEQVLIKFLKSNAVINKQHVDRGD